MKRKLHFVVVAVDGSVASTVFAPIELVQACRAVQAGMPELTPCEISTEILSPGGVPFLASSGYRLPVDGGLRELPAGTVVFLPGFGMPHPGRLPGRRFKLETGESVQAFIQRLRIDRAKLLLETSTTPIEQIVDQIGYHDTSAFARRFKQHTRLTPNEYRERYGLSAKQAGVVAGRR